MRLPGSGPARYAPRMSGYVASARIVSAGPRLARGERLLIVVEEVPDPGPGSAIVIEAVPRDSSPRGPIVERLLAARDRWSQLTFFLFDPNSWRT